MTKMIPQTDRRPDSWERVEGIRRELEDTPMAELVCQMDRLAVETEGLAAVIARSKVTMTKVILQTNRRADSWWERVEGIRRELEDTPMAELVCQMDRLVVETEGLAVVIALSKALSGDKLEPGDHRALFSLSEGLALLRDGVVVPMLRPRKISGGRPMSRHGRSLMLGLVAGCIALENAGLSRKQARAELAKICRTLKLRASGQRAITAGTLYSWWKKYRGEEGVRVTAELLSGEQLLYRKGLVSSERPTSGEIIRQLTEIFRTAVPTRSCPDMEVRTLS